MGKINMGRVILGGLVAGVFMYIAEFVLQGVILSGAWGEAQKAIGKTSAEGPRGAPA